MLNQILHQNQYFAYIKLVDKLNEKNTKYIFDFKNCHDTTKRRCKLEHYLITNNQI